MEQQPVEGVRFLGFNRFLWARVDARTAVDAQALVDRAHVGDRKRFLRALVHADAASDALVSVDGNSHDDPHFSRDAMTSALKMPHYNPTED